LDDIPYVDYPEIQINKNESTQMPFRYVKDDKGMPVMPEVCVLRLVTPFDDEKPGTDGAGHVGADQGGREQVPR
jgi:hypothetical protein